MCAFGVFRVADVFFLFYLLVAVFSLVLCFVLCNESFQFLTGS